MQLLKSLKRKVKEIAGMVPEEAGEKDHAWYDKAFEEGTSYQVHYTESGHYPIWTVIMDRLESSDDRSILEIACGPAQLASAMTDRGIIRSYCGIDFSPKRIERARENNPELTFRVDDVFTTDVFESFDYDIVISTEFLEHVERDLDVVKRIRSGARFIGTVPNYPWRSHVRFFESAQEVEDRYSPYFRNFTVSPILRMQTGQTIFVMDGHRI